MRKRKLGNYSLLPVCLPPHSAPLNPHNVFVFSYYWSCLYQIVNLGAGTMSNLSVCPQCLLKSIKEMQLKCMNDQKKKSEKLTQF